MSCVGCAQRREQIRAAFRSLLPQRPVTRAAIVREARTWLGTPWHHQAYQRGAGTDCIGLVGGIALALGIDGGREWAANPAYHRYGTPADPKYLLATADLFLDRAETPELGDIFLMNYDRAPMHFAIVTETEPAFYVIHAALTFGSVVEHRLDEHWRRLVSRVYRYRGIAP